MISDCYRRALHSLYLVKRFVISETCLRPRALNKIVSTSHYNVPKDFIYLSIAILSEPHLYSKPYLWPKMGNNGDSYIDIALTSLLTAIILILDDGSLIIIAIVTPSELILNIIRNFEGLKFF